MNTLPAFTTEHIGSGDRSDLGDGDNCSEDSVELVDELHFGLSIQLA